MIGLDALVRLVEAHPFLVVFPLAIVEGPIVTVVAAWFLRGSLTDLVILYVICVLADLVGDAGFYALGRRAHSLSPKWQRRLALNEDRLLRLESHFKTHGPATLAVGKLTHSVGFAVLIAAGAWGMAFGRFLFWNLLATLPKSLLLVLVGYAFGAAYGAVDAWIFRVSLILLAVLIAGGLFWTIRKKDCQS